MGRRGVWRAGGGAARRGLRRLLDAPLVLWTYCCVVKGARTCVCVCVFVFNSDCESAYAFFFSFFLARVFEIPSVNVNWMAAKGESNFLSVQVSC